MEETKIGVITKPIICWTGMTAEDRHEWGKVGMIVNIEEFTESHYYVSDPDAELLPILVTRNLIERITIKWKLVV